MLDREASERRARVSSRDGSMRRLRSVWNPRVRGSMVAIAAAACAAGCRDRRPADAEAVALRVVAEPDGTWLEHPALAFRFRDPGDGFSISTGVLDPVSRELLYKGQFAGTGSTLIVI